MKLRIVLTGTSDFAVKLISLGVLISLLIIAAKPLQAFDNFSSVSGKAGPFVVKTVDRLILQDKIRDRKVPIKVYYPEGKGTFPIIIYSHGLGGSKNTKVFLGKFLTSHGYVCIHMTHFGSDSSLWRFDKTFQDNLKILSKAVRNRKSLTDRPQDVTFVIDSLDLIENSIPNFKGHLERQAIGVTGHSFGAFTTLAVAGAYSEKSKRLFGRSFLDPRPGAFLAMSPQGPKRGNPENIYQKITRPFLSMTGSLDSDVFGSSMSPESRLIPYQNMPVGDKYSLWIKGANHGTFGDNRTMEFANGSKWVNAPDPAHHKVIKTVHLAFWNAYLKGSVTARRFLRSGSIERISKGVAKLDYK